jgi:hypothetical protein
LNAGQIHQACLSSGIDQQVEIARVIIFFSQDRTEHPRIHAAIFKHDSANLFPVEF